MRIPLCNNASQYLDALSSKPSSSHSVKCSLSATIKKVIVVIIAILLSPILLPAAVIIGMAHGGECLRQRICPADLAKKMQAVIDEEHQIAFDALQKIFKEQFKSLQRNCQIDPNECAEEKYKRHLVRLTVVISEIDFKEARKTIYRLRSIGELKDYALNVLLLDEKQWLYLHLSVQAEIKSISTKQKRLRVEREFDQIFLQLTNILSKQTKNYKNSNKNVLDLLRKALKSRYYQVKKECGAADPRIAFLQRLAAALWTDVKYLRLYHQMGKEVCRLAPREENLARLFREAHQVVKSNFPNYETFYCKLKYAIKQPLRTVVILASLGGLPKLIASLFGRGTYDSRRNLSNHSFLQSVSSIQMNGQRVVKFNNVYGGCPVQGDSVIYPEFEAVIQAAETNWVHPEKAVPDTPAAVFYTNLQKIDGSHAEAMRSKALMGLNLKYPCSFFGITLAKDSPFYRDAEPGRNSAAAHWPGAEKYGEEMFKNLYKPLTFTLERRPKNGNGFYFPPGSINQAAYGILFKMVIAQATDFFSQHPETCGKRALKLKAAYQEYVYLLIEALFESMLAQSLFLNGIKNPIVMSQRACKENVDRGGVENTKYLYAHLDASIPDRNELLIGMLHGRSLSATRRVILPKRANYLGAFVKFIAPSDFKQSSEDLLSNLNFKAVSRCEMALSESCL